MITVKVPATSANMGPGFDTMGVALSLYNRVEIKEISEGLRIVNLNAGGYVPKDENNLICRAMQRVFERSGYTPSGLQISQKSDIPMTRGLGSSSACIIAGLVGANILAGRPFSYGELLDMAADMEGHPDNVAPALYGGLCLSVRNGGHTICKSAKLSPDLRFAVMVPDYFVATKKSRNVLPELVSREDAVFNISRAVLFYTALAQGDLDSLRTAAEDRLHQPYRQSYIEGMEEIFERAYDAGAKAVYLSGSGPTILAIIDRSCRGFQNTMNAFFRESIHKWSCKLLTVDNVGTVVKTDQ